jgi:hypothetical protein
MNFFLIGIIAILPLIFTSCKRDNTANNQNENPNANNAKVLHYEFANNLNDISGNNFNGYSDTAIDFVPDRFSRSNQAIRFNGPLHKSNFLIPALGAKQVAKKFTVSMWFTITTANNNNLIFKSDYLNDFKSGLTIQTVNGKLGVITGDGTNHTTYLGTLNLPHNTWQHALVSIDSNITNIYLNGQAYNNLMTITNNGNYTSPGFVNSNTANGLLGGLQPYALTDGKLDDFRIYNRPFSATEAVLLYNYRP